jgi:hypothetical protein
MGDNHKNVKMEWGHLKIFFSRPTGPILTKLGINYRLGEGIEVCSNEGDFASPREDNSKRVKNTFIFLKSFPKPAGQILQIILG